MLELRSQAMTGLPYAVRRALQLFAVLCVFCFLAEFVCRFGYHFGFPYIWPLEPYYPPFADFTFFTPRLALFHTRLFFRVPGFNYPAPLSVALAVLFRLPWPLRTFLFSTLLGFTLAAATVARALRREGLSTPAIVALLSAFAFSYPLWFELEQANVEFVVWLVIALGLGAFLRGRPYAAAACFGIAGSMKLFPFIFLGLLLARRQYRQLAFGCLAGLATVVGSMWLETGSITTSWQGTNAGLEYFRQHYTLTLNGFDHSLFEVEKRIFGIVRFLRQGPGKIPWQELAPMLRFYLPSVALAGTILFFVRIRNLPVVNQILALTVASILLPPVSFDYTLIHLYAPCALLVLIAVRSAKRRVQVPGLAASLLTMAVLLAPETEVIANAVTLEGEIKCLALLALFFLAVRYPFHLDPVSTSEGAILLSDRGHTTQSEMHNVYVLSKTASEPVLSVSSRQAHGVPARRTNLPKRGEGEPARGRRTEWLGGDGGQTGAGLAQYP